MLTMGNTGYRRAVQPVTKPAPEYNLNPGVADGADIQSWSGMASNETYFIFAVADMYKAVAFKAWALNAGIGFKALFGKYKGMTEWAFICNWKHRDAVAPWYTGQESLLLLKPLWDNGELLGARPAFLYWLKDNGDGRKDTVTPIGYFKETTAQYALAQDAYTFDPSTGCYYICKKKGE